MGPTNNSQRIKLALAGVAAAAVAVGSGIGLWGCQAPEADLTTKPAIEQPAIEQPGSGPDSATTPGTASESPITQQPGGDSPGSAAAPVEEAGAIAARPDSATTPPPGPSVYWLGADGNQVEYNPERIAIAPNTSAETQLRTAMGELLAGGQATAIPPGTKLLGAEVKGQDIYVDLSSEFTAGGGSSAMAARLGQVIYTAAAIEPDAQVWISVNGKPLTELGGEGLFVEQPMDVATFERDFGI